MTCDECGGFGKRMSHFDCWKCGGMGSVPDDWKATPAGVVAARSAVFLALVGGCAWVLITVLDVLFAWANR